MDIQNRPTQSITPYARNPRKNAAAVAKVRASIAEFGFRQPIVVDESGVIVAGHTRYQAALDLGLKTVPVHVATGLSKAQIKAYRIADNRTASEAEWDMELLALEMEELKEMEFNLDLTGFGEDELRGMNLGQLEETESPDDFKEVDEDIETEHTCPKCGYAWSGGD